MGALADSVTLRMRLHPLCARACGPLRRFLLFLRLEGGFMRGEGWKSTSWWVLRRRMKGLV